MQHRKNGSTDPSCPGRQVKTAMPPRSRPNTSQPTKVHKRSSTPAACKKIEMTCHLRYCPQCQGDPVSLFSVLGCNLYDDHETEHNHEPANESSDEDETQTLSM